MAVKKAALGGKIGALGAGLQLSPAAMRPGAKPPPRAHPASPSSDISSESPATAANNPAKHGAQQGVQVLPSATTPTPALISAPPSAKEAPEQTSGAAAGARGTGEGSAGQLRHETASRPRVGGRRAPSRAKPVTSATSESAPPPAQRHDTAASSAAAMPPA